MLAGGRKWATAICRNDRPALQQTVRSFRLERSFVRQFKDKPVKFGFNGLGELVYYRTYARLKDNGARERWFETVERVVNGTFSMQERWITSNVLGWDQVKAQASAQEMYRRIFDMKFLPPGRGLWCMGTQLTEERGLFAALNNCAFVSTEEIVHNIAEPFCFTMDASMLGVGVGFDTKGAGKILVHRPDNGIRTIVIDDSREGWVESLRELLFSYTAHKNPAGHRIQFDYSRIRAAGEPIKGFGGQSSGAEPLKVLHTSISDTLDKMDGEPITVTAIVDIMNLIGRCVVAGNVRRTAEIAFGDPESTEYIELKDYSKNPQRADFGWTSNNSVFAKLGMDYTQVVENVKKNGEPGFAWLDNMRNFGRMNGELDQRDYRAAGGNPCLEQTLESHELCCLVETFPDHHADLEDYKETLKYAFLYAKTVTLGKTHWPKSNRVMLRNRRIGCSMSGLAQFIANRGMHELQEWTEQGYDVVQEVDKEISEWLAIPQSIKTTCIKPSGTVSLLAGATPGMHAPESRFYIRRVRLAKNSDLVQPLLDAGYHLEPNVADPENTLVVSIPIDAGEGIRTSKELTMWEQLSMAAFLQKHWADNQVSCTVTFDAETEGRSLVNALDIFQYQLKGVSFLPRLEMGAYEQMPYEEISKEQYLTMSASIGKLSLPNHDMEDDDDSYTEEHSSAHVDELSALVVDEGVDLAHELPDSFCDSSSCEVNFALASK